MRIREDRWISLPNRRVDGGATSMNPPKVIMSDLTAFDSHTGDANNLRVFAPEVNCPFKRAAQRQFKALDPLNIAFQQATGWSLQVKETAHSFQLRNQLGRVELPAVPEMAIADLSPLLPPGIPAVSRIYSEKLVDEVNELLNELGDLRKKACLGELKHTPLQAERPAHAADSDGEAEPLNHNLPFRSSNLALTPIMVESSRATVDWFVEESGMVRFAAMVFPKASNPCERELIAARTAFLAEARHGSSNRATCHAIRQSINRLFASDCQIDILTGALNPLTGDITIVGSEAFHVLTTGFSAVSAASLTDVATYHLPRGQHMLLSHWGAGNANAGWLDDWGKRLQGNLQGRTVTELKTLFTRQMDQSIPALPEKPGVVLSLSRC